MNDNMLECIKDILVIMGFVSCVVIIVFVVACIITYIKDVYIDIRHKLKIKNRFNKPPQAKCYCIDCVRWNSKTGACSKFEVWHTADCWFCWDAEPKKPEIK